MILTACDGRYLSEASALIKSCARHEPQQTFYLFLVNGEAIPDAVIKGWHPQIIIERVAWSVERERWRAIMCCARSIPIVALLEKYQEPVLYLDSDILVRRPLAELWQLLESCDLLVKHRPFLNHIGAAGTPYASTFNNGVILIKPSAAGLQFAHAYNDKLRHYIDSGKPLEIYDGDLGIQCIIDQELLYVTYLEFQDVLQFQPLPDKFNDAKFKTDSIIWHGKGTARDHWLYVLERVRYEYNSLFYPLAPLSKILLAYRDRKKKR